MSEFLREGDNSSEEPRISELIFPLEIISYIQGKIQEIRLRRAEKKQEKYFKEQLDTLKSVRNDVLGSGEKFRKFCNKYPAYQILNTIRELFLQWNQLVPNGHKQEEVLKNIKYYLQALNRDSARVNDGSKIGVYIGDAELLDALQIEDIDARLYAQYFLDNLFSYGTGDNPNNEISFDLLSKLGINDLVSFFQGTNTDTHSQFDYVVMGLFDAIRREVFITDKRKKSYKQANNIDVQRQLNEEDGRFTEKYKSSIQLGLEGRYSEVAERNIQYYIGVLQLLYKLAQEQGEKGFSWNTGEYFERVFQFQSDSEADMDLIHELSQAQVKIKMAFGTPQEIPEELPKGVVRLRRPISS